MGKKFLHKHRMTTTKRKGDLGKGSNTSFRVKACFNKADFDLDGAG